MDRFDKDARSRVALEVHRRFLRRHVPPRSYVLEIGAGPGRFTIELAEMGCRVVVSDVSPVQLEANARRVAEAGLEGAVVERRLLDVRDLTALPDGGFDAVVAYGGPLSYAFEDAEPSLAGMLRVVRPGGRVVASVMSLIGTLRMFVRVIPAYADKGRLDELKAVMATGDNRLDTGGHPCRMFRWSEIEAMAGRLACAVLGASASNFLSSADLDVIAYIEQTPLLWQLLLDWEEEYYAEPGAVDSATHLLFAMERSLGRNWGSARRTSRGVSLAGSIPTASIVVTEPAIVDTRPVWPRPLLWAPPAVVGSQGSHPTSAPTVWRSPSS